MKISPIIFVLILSLLIALSGCNGSKTTTTTTDDATQTAIINTPDTTQPPPIINDIPAYDSFKTQSGNYYEGYAINRVPNGYGIMTYTDGWIIEGVFTDGLTPRNGKAKITYPDGSVYKGDVDIYGDATGQGMKIYANGSIYYIGGVKNLQNEGYGEASYPDGSLYKGYWKDGLKDGNGTMYVNEQPFDMVYSNGVDITPKASPVYVSPIQTYPTYPTAQSSGTIKSKIDGDFEGWDGETIFKLMNGQIWQQSSYDYEYHYDYSPDIIIYPSGGLYKMHVDGVDDDIYVIRLK